MKYENKVELKEAKLEQVSGGVIVKEEDILNDIKLPDFDTDKLPMLDNDAK